MSNDQPRAVGDGRVPPNMEILHDPDATSEFAAPPAYEWGSMNVGPVARPGQTLFVEGWVSSPRRPPASVLSLVVVENGEARFGHAACPNNNSTNVLDRFSPSQKSESPSATQRRASASMRSSTKQNHNDLSASILNAVKSQLARF